MIHPIFLLFVYVINSDIDNISVVNELNITFRKNGRNVEVYAWLKDLDNSKTYLILGHVSEKNKPLDNFVCFPILNTNVPYMPIGSLWISQYGEVTIYKDANCTSAYVFGNYFSI